MLVVTIASFATAYLGYNSSARELEHRVAVELLRIVTSAAPLVDGDVHEEIFFDLEYGLEGEDAFAEVQSFLILMRNSNEMSHREGLSPLYTFRRFPSDDGQKWLEFVVMTDPNAEGNFYSGAVILEEPFHEGVFAGKAGYSGIYQDTEGHWISAAAPIHDSSGEVVGILQADRPVEFYLVYLNKIRMQYFLGASAGVFIGLLLALYFSRLSVAPITELQKATEQFERGRIRYRIRRRRGDEFGKLFHAFNAMADSLVKAMDELRRKNQLLEADAKELEAIAYFARLNPGPVMRFDIHGNLLTTNEPAAELVYKDGYKQLNIIDIFPEYLADRLPELIKNSDQAVFELDQDGSFYQFVIRGVAEFGFANAYGTDVSDRKRFELQMILAMEKAESANVAKSQFLATMSHELRTPMNAIIGFTDMGLQQELTPKLEKYLKAVAKASNNLLGLINDILDFSKIEAGKMELERVHFNLYEEIDSLSVMFAKSAFDRRIELVFEMDQSIPRNLVGDVHKLRQMLTNLVSNAIKFTEKGGVALRVTIVGEDDSSLGLHFSVKDTGIGVPETKIHKLFEAFTQADNSTTRRYGGTGLGLTICKSMVELLGGELKVESVEGEGSEFSFAINFDVVDTVEGEGEALCLGDLDGKNIALYDPNAVSCDVYGRVLRNLKANVNIYFDGEKVVKDFANEAPIDLLIANLQAENWSVLSICKEIRSLHAELPILMLTCGESETVGKELANAGINAWVPKPLSFQSMLQAVVNTLENPAEENITQGQESVFAEQSFIEKIAGASILIAEDDPVNQLLIREFFDELPVTYKLVENGLDAFNALTFGSYEILLLDMQMPVMDGFTAARKIRDELPQLSEFPILALTANAIAGDREKCLSAGMSDYLTKPISFSLLQERLLFWLDKVGFEATPLEDSSEEQASVAESEQPQQSPANISASESENAEVTAEQPPNKEKIAIADSSQKLIDKSVALANVGGREDLLQRVLSAFDRKYEGAENEFRNLMGQEEKEGAIRFVHTLKGGGKTIGALALSETACELEGQLKESDDPSQELIAKFYAEISLCQQEVKDLLNQLQ